MDCEGYACKLFTKYDSTLMQQEPGVQGGGGGMEEGGGGQPKGAPKCSSLMFAFLSSTNGTKHCLPTPAVMMSHDQ